MFRLIIIITSLLLIKYNAAAQVQYLGGTNNGFTAQTQQGISLFISDSLYNGDNRNGFSFTTTTADLSVADSIYKGDTANGFTELTQAGISLFLSDSLYNGDNRNGFSFVTTNADLSVADSMYNGDFSDGFTKFTQAGISLFLSDTLYNGDTKNGFTKFTQAGISLFVTDSIYIGNNRNGFYQITQSNISLFVTDSIYHGATGRGETILTELLVDLNLPCNGNVVYWNGSINIIWGNASNWDCGVLPSINSIVIIPAGKPRYPTLYTTAEIKSLHLKPGTTVTINNNALLILNGQ